MHLKATCISRHFLINASLDQSQKKRLINFRWSKPEGLGGCKDVRLFEITFFLWSRAVEEMLMSGIVSTYVQ